MKKVFKGEFIFARILIPLVAGITAAIFFPPGASLLTMLFKISALLLLLTLYFLVLNYKRYKIYYKKWLPGIVFHLLAFSLGYHLTSQKYQNLSSTYFAHYKSDALVVRISSEPKLSGDIVRFESEVIQILQKQQFRRVSGKLLIALKISEREKISLKYGDEMLIPSTYNEVDPPFNPHEFDFKRYLFFHGIYHQSFIPQTLVKVLSHSRGNPLIAYSLNLRQKMVDSFAAYIHDPDALAVASTLILGYRANLSPDVLSAYSKTGTMHVLSVSGMHVILILQILTVLLFFLKRQKAVQTVLIIILIWFYAMLTGFSPSVCRAATVITIFVGGRAISRKSNSYNLLSASAVLLLVYNPFYLTDAGFQLSYLAVFSLIYFNPKIYHLFYFKNKYADKVWKPIALSIAAQTVTFPLAMYYFNQFPVYFLLGNLFLLLPVEGVMYSGIAFLLCVGLENATGISFKPVLDILAAFLERCLILSNKGLSFIEHLPLSSLSFSHYHMSFYVFLLVAIISLPLSVSLKNKRIFWFCMVLATCMVSIISATKIQNSSHSQLIFYSLRKNCGFSYVDKSRALIYSDLSPRDKTFSYSIFPSVQALGAEPDTIHSSTYRYQDFYCFRGYKVLIWDKRFDNYSFPRKIYVDAVLLNQNSNIRCRDLMRCVHFNVLLIGGNNKEYKIEKWQAEANDLKLAYRVLKRNPAYLVSF